ncbi:Ataxin-7-like protein 3 like protein [Argiope bruennichi]|uniref:Ataxin-7-like protein 3 like protein n=1 Tax=Argiope bruennichi TaxID=94029 RepID=A0A8T0E014_ARGBR|nr:Ataxin-7-like protein 3 like protein [Argiope bruennichi]
MTLKLLTIQDVIYLATIKDLQLIFAALVAIKSYARLVTHLICINVWALEDEYKERERLLSGDTFVPSAAEANYSEMTIETIRDCLSQMCGVISERTGRFCRNTLKCSMHVDDQRREVRDMLLGSSSTDQPADDIHIDVDTVDESSHAQLWYTNRKTSKKNTMVVESSACASAASTSSNKQEDYSSSLSKYASYS